MKKLVILFSCLIFCFCGCNSTSNEDEKINKSEEEQSVINQAITEIQENEKSIDEIVSIPTIINEIGQPDGFIGVKVNDISVQKDKVTGVNEDALSYCPSELVDKDGTLKNSRIFIMINIDLINENQNEIEINTSSFNLESITDIGIVGYTCFYQDNLEEGCDAKSAGLVKLSAKETKNVNLGYFVTSDFFTSTSCYINPKCFESDPDLDIEENYIKLPNLLED